MSACTWGGTSGSTAGIVPESNKVLGTKLPPEAGHRVRGSPGAVCAKPFAQCSQQPACGTGLSPGLAWQEPVPGVTTVALQYTNILPHAFISLQLAAFSGRQGRVRAG